MTQLRDITLTQAYANFFLFFSLPPSIHVYPWPHALIAVTHMCLTDRNPFLQYDTHKPYLFPSTHPYTHTLAPSFVYSSFLPFSFTFSRAPPTPIFLIVSMHAPQHLATSIMSPTIDAVATATTTAMPLLKSDVTTTAIDTTSPLTTRSCMSNNTALPAVRTLSLRNYLAPETRTQFLQEMRQSLMTIGTFYIKDHGVATELTTGAMKTVRDYFSLALEEKKKMMIGNSRHFRGYKLIGKFLWALYFFVTASFCHFPPPPMCGPVISGTVERNSNLAQLYVLSAPFSLFLYFSASCEGASVVNFSFSVDCSCPWCLFLHLGPPPLNGNNFRSPYLYLCPCQFPSVH